MRRSWRGGVETPEREERRKNAEQRHMRAAATALLPCSKEKAMPERSLRQLVRYFHAARRPYRSVPARPALPMRQMKTA